VGKIFFLPFVDDKLGVPFCPPSPRFSPFALDPGLRHLTPLQCIRSVTANFLLSQFLYRRRTKPKQPELIGISRGFFPAGHFQGSFGFLADFRPPTSGEGDLSLLPINCPPVTGLRFPGFSCLVYPCPLPLLDIPVAHLLRTPPALFRKKVAPRALEVPVIDRSFDLCCQRNPHLGSVGDPKRGVFFFFSRDHGFYLIFFTLFCFSVIAGVPLPAPNLMSNHPLRRQSLDFFCCTGSGRVFSAIVPHNKPPPTVRAASYVFGFFNPLSFLIRLYRSLLWPLRNLAILFDPATSACCLPPSPSFRRPPQTLHLVPPLMCLFSLFRSATHKLPMWFCWSEKLLPNGQPWFPPTHRVTLLPRRLPGHHPPMPSSSLPGLFSWQPFSPPAGMAPTSLVFGVIDTSFFSTRT